MRQYHYMDAEDAIELIEGLKADTIMQLGATDPEKEAFEIAIDAIKAHEIQTKQIEQLKQYNKLYFSRISDYITLFDKLKKSKKNPEDHKYYQEECKKIEAWMRSERDRVNALLAKKKPDPQLEINLE